MNRTHICILAYEKVVKHYSRLRWRLCIDRAPRRAVLVVLTLKDSTLAVSRCFCGRDHCGQGTQVPAAERIRSLGQPKGYTNNHRLFFTRCLNDESIELCVGRGRMKVMAQFTLCVFSLLSCSRSPSTRYLVDPASSHMFVTKIKPCMSKNKPLNGESANGSLNQLLFI